MSRTRLLPAHRRVWHRRQFSWDVSPAARGAGVFFPVWSSFKYLSHPGAVTKPGLTPGILHYGFLLQWLDLTNTNHPYHFIINLLAQRLFLYEHELISLLRFLLPAIAMEPNEEDGALRFSSCLFPSASSHRPLLGHSHIEKGEPQFEVVCTLTNRFSLNEYLN